MFGWLAKWLKFSKHVHLRTHELCSLREVVDIIDGFLDDELEYPLEWDDFVSWENGTPSVEVVRKRIAALEPLAFSEKPEERAQFVDRLVEERNRAAALIGIAARNFPSDGE
jgi:hypothetical protein